MTIRSSLMYASWTYRAKLAHDAQERDGKDLMQIYATTKNEQ